MAKQKGIVKLRGSINGITFYKTQDGYLARESGGVDRKRIANDPAYRRTRENASEFGHCGRSSALLVRAFRCILRKSIDNRVISRLVKQLFSVIQADQTSLRGHRNVLNGELGFLLGFEFNARSSFTANFFTPISTAVNRVTGEITVNIGSFVPTDMVVAPSGATHYKIISAGAAVDFVSNSFVTTHSETQTLLFDMVATAPVQHINLIPANSLHPLFVVVGLVFYQEVGGVLYALNNGAHNSFSIVQIEQAI